MKHELILAAPNLQSWLTDTSPREGIISCIRSKNARVKLILTTYDALRFLGEEGADHLRQSALNIRDLQMQLRENERAKLEVYFHRGTATLSAVFVDPESPDGVLFFTPRWGLQYDPADRLTCRIDKHINAHELFDGIYSGVLLLMQSDKWSMTLDQMLATPQHVVS